MNKILFLFTTIILVIVGFSIQGSFSEIPSPKKQLEEGVPPDKVICKDGFILLIKIKNGFATCVKQHTAEKLVMRGWGIIPQPSQNEQTKTSIDDLSKSADSSKPSNQLNSDCDDLVTSDTANQVMIVENNLDCIPHFVKLLKSDPRQHLDAFYVLVSSPTATDRLFSHFYDELYYDRLNFDETVTEDFSKNLPEAIEKCEGSFRCAEWEKFILPYLNTIYDCSEIKNYDEDKLIEALRHADYYCTESIALALVPTADESTINELLDVMETDEDENARRNAARILIRFAEHAEGESPHILVTKTLANDVKNSIINTLKKENSSYVIPELTVLIDAHFRPFFETQQYLEAISKDPKFDSVARWRAINAMQNIMYEKENITEDDVEFLLGSLRSDDLWVRAEAAFICEILKEEQLNPSQKHHLISGLDNAYVTEENLIPKSFIAKALDRYNKTNLYNDLEADFEKNHLSNIVSKNGITIKSSLPANELSGYLELMESQRKTFFQIMGSPFDTPVKDDSNDSFVVIVLATPEAYSDYMNSFVGYGANAGGLYLENKGTLYTFQRNENQSTYTVKDLIKHEFTHYLQGRYVYSGMWSDADYHSEPKGWADEGLAEFFAQSVLVNDYNYSISPSQKYLNEICGKNKSEYRDLDSLLRQREGYDKSGQWDYADGWAFTYYLMTKQQKSAAGLYNSFRDESYKLDDFTTIAEVSSIDSLETDWHNEMEIWCESK